MILIISDPTDAHTTIVARALRRLGVRLTVFDTARVPERARLALEVGGATPRGTIDGCSLAEITAVWLRRPHRPHLQGKNATALAACSQLIESVWFSLQDRFWVNPYASDVAARLKPHQLAVAQSVGLRVPKTLVTNEPDEAICFVDECGGTAVYKSLHAVMRSTDTKRQALYAQRVTASDVVGRRAQIAAGPCLFQEYVPKRAEWRVTIMGSRMFVDEIESATPAVTVDRVDWRADLEWRRHRAAVMPGDLRVRLAALMQRLGLVLGCVDLVKTADGEMVFLEINPDGQWIWVQEMTGLPLVRTFATMLSDASPV